MPRQSCALMEKMSAPERHSRPAPGPGPARGRHGTVDPSHWSDRVAQLSNEGQRIPPPFENPRGPSQGHRIGSEAQCLGFKPAHAGGAGSSYVASTQASEMWSRETCLFQRRREKKERSRTNKIGSMLVRVNPGEPVDETRRHTLFSGERGRRLRVLQRSRLASSCPSSEPSSPRRLVVPRGRTGRAGMSPTRRVPSAGTFSLAARLSRLEAEKTCGRDPSPLS